MYLIHTEQIFQSKSFDNMRTTILNDKEYFSLLRYFFYMQASNNHNIKFIQDIELLVNGLLFKNENILPYF